MKILFCACLLALQLMKVDSMLCFNCERVFQPAICMQTVQCGAHEACYVERGVTNNGGISFYSGCYPLQDCPRTRRNHFDTQTCVTCCNGDLCNSEGCGSMSNQDVCYSCSDIKDPEDCKTTSICEPGQHCGTVSKSDNSTVVYDMGCFNDTTCAETNTLCCNSTACNFNLTASYTPIAAPAVVTTTLSTLLTSTLPDSTTINSTTSMSTNNDSTSTGFTTSQSSTSIGPPGSTITGSTAFIATSTTGHNSAASTSSGATATGSIGSTVTGSTGSTVTVQPGVQYLVQLH